MIAASTPSSLRCPICGTWSVRPMEGRIRWRSPSHRCAQCATRLRAELSIRALWAVPVGVLACGLAGALTMLLSSTATGAFRTAILAGA